MVQVKGRMQSESVSPSQPLPGYVNLSREEALGPSVLLSIKWGL